VNHKKDLVFKYILGTGVTLVLAALSVGTSSKNLLWGAS